MKLSIVIPARNEAGNVEKTVVLLRDHLDSTGISDFEILVIDDGSTDATYALVMAEHDKDTRIRVVRNTGRNGFGRAVSLGLNTFTGDAVVVYMADASDSPSDVVRYYHILRDEADCAFGSRFLSDSKIYDYPKFKLLINRIANFAIKLMFNLPYNDTTNAFKGYRASVIEGCRPFVSPHFNLTIEIPLKAFVRGYSFKIIPISWRNREIGVSSLRLKEQGSRYLYTLLTVWFEWLLVKRDTQRTDDGVFQTWAEITATRELEAVKLAERERDPSESTV
jgi:dolichol-phosphate mannosyltransferase